MTINNPNYTETNGNVANVQTMFSGMPEFRLYDRAEQQRLTHARKETTIQANIYNLPNEKLL